MVPPRFANNRDSRQTVPRISVQALACCEALLGWAFFGRVALFRVAAGSLPHVIVDNQVQKGALSMNLLDELDETSAPQLLDPGMRDAGRELNSVTDLLRREGASAERSDLDHDAEHVTVPDTRRDTSGAARPAGAMGSTIVTPRSAEPVLAGLLGASRISDGF